ncbi:hypothetical protein C1I95_10290 [Micromonospora craterilacus]|uniref:DUF4386 domain-containing protein n=1 Tax=Micromonospora craterilacus TaxID=1655439 RepID=A0A2W2E7S8_9ACTN|nr:hypothetical protein [Micromonospora craterilacus]PZG20132.1 hypothetical protein C1I95_10290 [Micromonospora craterilacus]
MSSTSPVLDTTPTRRNSLRLSATLLLAGQLLYILVTQFHADGDANNHPAVFGEYAGNGIWTLVHVGQFAAMAIFLAGLLALFSVLDLRAGAASWAARFGAAAAVAALALYGVLQAVDGVALKQTVNAWASAPDSEKAARFASAEAIRWLEWGVRSYHNLALGIALLLLAVALVWTARIPRPIVPLIGLSGLAYLMQGWVVGSVGFSQTETIAIVLAFALDVVWMIWLVVVAWRMPDSEAPSPG